MCVAEALKLGMVESHELIVICKYVLKKRLSLSSQATLWRLLQDLNGLNGRQGVTKGEKRGEGVALLYIFSLVSW